MQSKKAPKKCVNPCVAKGRSGGSRFGGVSYQIKDHFMRVGGCECAQPFFDLGLRTVETTRYSITGPESQNPGILIPLTKSSEPIPEKSILIVPCEEKFRHKNSEGTQFYSEVMGFLTSFQGCQALEEELLAQKLVCHRPPKQEVLGWSESVIQDDGFEDLDTFLDEDEPLTKSHKKPEASLQNAEEIIQEKHDREKWANFIQSRFKDLKLTYKQKSAFNLLFPTDGEAMTYAAAAKKLRISIDSLKSRIDGIKKKAKDRFPEFSQKNRATQIKGLYRSMDRQDDGFFYRSEAKRVAPLYRIDPMTGFRTEIPVGQSSKKAAKSPQTGIRTIKQVQLKATYYPAHNGTWAAWIPVLESAGSAGSGGFDSRSAKKRLSEIRILELWERQDRFSQQGMRF